MVMIISVLAAKSRVLLLLLLLFFLPFSLYWFEWLKNLEIKYSLSLPSNFRSIIKSIFRSFFFSFSFNHLLALSYLTFFIFCVFFVVLGNWQDLDWLNFLYIYSLTLYFYLYFLSPFSSCTTTVDLFDLSLRR